MNYAKTATRPKPEDNEIYLLTSREHIDPLGLTSKDFEVFAERCLDVRKIDITSEKFSFKVHNLPHYQLFFYNFIHKYGYIPNMHEFVNEYEIENFFQLQPLKKKMRGLRSDLTKCYLSCYRELHLYHLLREQNGVDRVIFRLKEYLTEKKLFFILQNEQWKALIPEVKSRTYKFYGDWVQNNPKKSTKHKNQIVQLNLDEERKVKTIHEDIVLHDESTTRKILNE